MYTNAQVRGLSNFVDIFRLNSSSTRNFTHQININEYRFLLYMKSAKMYEFIKRIAYHSQNITEYNNRNIR